MLIQKNTSELHKFYTSKNWRELSNRLKIECDYVCAKCKNKIRDGKHLIGHHKIELTDTNINNPQISLNPQNIEIICLDCHNNEHRRFGNAKQVYIIWGSPLSGKSTLVRQLMRCGDIVLDIDALWQAVTLQGNYNKPNNCKYNIFKLRDELLDQIATRYGQWHDAYVIGGYADKCERERVASKLGAGLIYCESNRAECLERAVERPSDWVGYVNDWWDRFTL